jgi:hypothetical protein
MTVGRGAEFIGNLDQRHLADTNSTQLIDMGCQGPYRAVYSGRGGVPQRRQDLEESHRTTIPALGFHLHSRSP